MAANELPKRIVRPLRSGQITIPVEFRQRLDIRDDSLLQISLEHDELRIRKLAVGQVAGETEWFKELYDYFAPVREEILERGISEEEVNADIDAAVRAVRAKNA
jgi:bifunctional DNA-binding transcriptional regulator/antitoxin component of YhaV-PrlF toxin-antitoxin module